MADLKRRRIEKLVSEFRMREETAAAVAGYLPEPMASTSRSAASTWKEAARLLQKELDNS